MNNHQVGLGCCAQVEHDPPVLYHWCPQCNFPQSVRPLLVDEVLAPIKVPAPNWDWFYYCRKCGYPLETLPAECRARYRYAAPLPAGIAADDARFVTSAGVQQLLNDGKHETAGQQFKESDGCEIGIDSTLSEQNSSSMSSTEEVVVMQVQTSGESAQAEQQLPQTQAKQQTSDEQN